jgi:hypothetical protein
MIKARMNSELKEGQERKGKDELGNEFIEKREGRTVMREYIGQKVEGKGHIAETKQIGKAPDRIEVNVNETNKGFMVVINVVIEEKTKTGTWMVSKDFVRNNKEQEKFYEQVKNYFKDVLVQAEIYPIVTNVKDKIFSIESKGKEPHSFPSEIKPKKKDPSEYVVVSGLYGEPTFIPWDEFEKDIFEKKKPEVKEV